MASPYYIVIVKGGENQRDIDVTQHADFFKLQQSIEKDDLLTVKMKDIDKQVLESDLIVDGGGIYYKFGFIGGQFKEGRLEIKDISPRFSAGRIDLELNATDKGNRLKKTVNNRVFKNNTLSQIVFSIAQAYDIDHEITSTEKVYKEVAQGNRTDHELITDLLDKEPETTQFYVKGDTIYLKKRELNKQPKRTFYFGDPKSGMISFRPKHKGMSQTAESTNTEATGFNNKNKEAIEKENQEEDEENLGKNEVAWDQNGNLQKQGKNKGTGKRIVTGEDNPDDVQNTADRRKEDKKMGNIEGDIELNPTLEDYIDEIITLSNVTLKYNGNYHVTTETFNVSGGEFTHRLKVKKDATSKPVSSESSENEKHNSQKGDKEGRKEKTVYEYTGSGEENRVTQ